MIHKRLLAFSLVFLVYLSLHAQPPLVQVWYETAIGPASTDTVNVYMRSATPVSRDIRAANLSMMYDSTCTTFQAYNTIFSAAWSVFIEQMRLEPFSVTYNSISYNKRFSYTNGDLGPPFSTGPITLNPVTGALLKVMTVIYTGTCGQNIVLEDEAQNSLNQIADTATQRIDWELLRINRILDAGLLGLQVRAYDEKKALVFWEMSENTPFERFQVEKWVEGHFKIISPEIEGHLSRTSGEIRHYEFIDPQAGASSNVYRLRMLDPVGQTRVSGRVELRRNFTISDQVVSLYPNPSTGQVFLHPTFHRESQYQVSVYNAMGSQVYSEKITLLPGGIQELDLSTLPAGVYQVMMEDLVEERYVKPLRWVKE